MQNKKIIIALAVILVIAAAFYWNANRTSEDMSETEEDIVACTEDARQCSDGSYVGRVAPSCNFAKCPDGSQAIEEPMFEDGTLPQSSNMSVEGTASSSLDQDMVQ